MCQIIVSEKSVPKHIADWLDSEDHPNKEIVVMGDPSNPVVQECLEMARQKGVEIVH